jgi:TonB family protein
MRVLVVDQDSTLLTAITRTLGEYFTIDAVTTKADCLDLVRLNEFEVIVAGERLDDGSGLELLGQLARSRPDMLRIFAAERERLKLLKGRLGPFGLFRTLSYPIEPRQLLAALSAAAGIDEEVEDAVEVQEAPPPAAVSAPAPRAPAPQARAPEPATARRAAPVGIGASAPSRVTASAPSRAPAQNVNSARAAAAPSKASTKQAAAPSSTARARTTAATGAPRQGPRQPTSEALAAASKLDIVARSKGYPPPSDTSPGRSAFLVGAGVVLVVGGLALSFKIFNTKDEPVIPATTVAATRSPHFPPEVVKLVADTEAAFQQDNFKTARTDVAALQQIAPDHPRLPFFESLLKKLDGNGTGAGTKGTSGRTFARHTSPPTASRASDASGATTTPSASNASAAPAPQPVRRQPDRDRDAAAAASVAVGSPSLTRTATTTTVATFSGRTLEDSNSATTSQPLATPSQAMATPVPRRPASGSGSGSSAPPTDTREPRLIQHVAAEYPPEAARRGIEGSVDVGFTVSPQGKVEDASVLSAVPADIFNRAALSAVRRWKYEPKTENGVPVEAHVQLRLQFKLDPRAN